MNVSSHVMVYVLDPLERAARTFVQQFVVVLMTVSAGSLIVHPSWLVALNTAGFAALTSIVTSVLTFKVPALNATLDLVLRVVKTFVQSIVGTLAAAQVVTITGADWKGALAIALPVALTALLTGLAALGVPGTSGASLLPAGTAVAIDDDNDVDGAVQAALTLNAGAPQLDSLNVSDAPSGPKHLAA